MTIRTESTRHPVVAATYAQASTGVDAGKVATGKTNSSVATSFERVHANGGDSDSGAATKTKKALPPELKELGLNISPDWKSTAKKIKKAFEKAGLPAELGITAAIMHSNIDKNRKVEREHGGLFGANLTDAGEAQAYKAGQDLSKTYTTREQINHAVSRFKHANTSNMSIEKWIANADATSASHLTADYEKSRTAALFILDEIS